MEMTLERRDVNGIEGFVHGAQKVVKAVSNILPFPISLSDTNGCIIGSTDPSRIGKQHEPSGEVLTKNTLLSFDEDKIKGMPNVHPGIAAPLKLNQQTVGVLGIIGPPEEVKPYAMLIKQYVEMTWHETFHRQLKELESKTLETFMQYILLNETTSQVKLEEYCRMFGISLNAERFCIVIHIGDSLISNIQQTIPIDQLKMRLLDCTRKAYQCGDDTICSFLNTEKIILLKKIDSEMTYWEALEAFTFQSEKLLEMFDVYHVTDASIAAGSLAQTLSNVNESYQEAEALRQFGQRWNPARKIYTYHNWDMVKELLRFQLPASFHEKVQFRLKHLFNDERFPELAKSFIAYCENNMTISQAANDLFIHRNTLIYRLQKINTLTSLNTGSFDDCVVLYLILKNAIPE
ncbi:hypothetical protein FFL34_15385 [Lentibacillus cibarius]|uniref:Transcriptional regulator n=1 Tax=Lentibacillus cibarius TaxID=2583219 RepID=A0A5S3QN36_9BACI|nr:hypothetical protein FFL34_15385 [Lentibacillus cibarius]